MIATLVQIMKVIEASSCVEGPSKVAPFFAPKYDWPRLGAKASVPIKRISGIKKQP